MIRAVRWALGLWLVIAVPAWAQTTWDPTTAPAATFSNGNLTIDSGVNMGGSGSEKTAFSTTSYYTGKLYFEVTINMAGDSAGDFTVGFGDTLLYSVTPASNQKVGAINYESSGCRVNKLYYYFTNSQGACVGGSYSGVLEVAVDLDNSLVWARTSAEALGVWNGSSANDPAMGTGGRNLRIGGGVNTVFIAITVSNFFGQDIATLNVGATAFTGVVPTGYTAWGAGGAALPTAQTTWNPSDKSSTIGLYNSNIRAQEVTNFTTGIVRATSSWRNSKVYFEVTYFGPAAFSWTVGLSTNATPLTGTGSAVGANTTSLGCNTTGNVQYNNGTIATCLSGSMTAGETLYVAADIGNNKIWFTSSARAGVWNNNALNNPATGVGGINLHIGGGLACPGLFIAFSGGASGGNADIAFINAGINIPFRGAVPSGFNPWQAGGSGTTFCAPPNNATNPHLWLVQ